MIWEFLSDPDNQKTLGWLGGGALIVVGGIWQAFLTLRKKPAKPKAPVKPAPTKASQGMISAVDGDILMDNVTIHSGGNSWVPAIIAGLGLVAVVAVSLLSGQGDCVVSGVNADGDITTESITITGEVSDVAC